MTAFNVLDVCRKERRALQDRLPSNCHVVLVIVEEKGQNDRNTAYSATTSAEEAAHLLHRVADQLAPF